MAAALMEGQGQPTAAHMADLLRAVAHTDVRCLLTAVGPMAADRMVDRLLHTAEVEHRRTVEGVAVDAPLEATAVVAALLVETVEAVATPAVGAAVTRTVDITKSWQS